VQAIAAQNTTMDLRFPGQWFQLETGLHYNWHRHYDPKTGRYLQPDPLGFFDGPGIYGYVGGNPLGRIDPQGLDTVGAALGGWFGGWIGRGAGGVAGEAVDPLGGGIPGSVLGGFAGNKIAGTVGDAIGDFIQMMAKGGQKKVRTSIRERPNQRFKVQKKIHVILLLNG
jgi:RHS repeat-associated protein